MSALEREQPMSSAKRNIKMNKPDDEQPPAPNKSREKPKASFFKRIASKIDIDVPTVLMMFKGAIPPTIGLAAYQSDRFAAEYTTLGFLISIVSILSLPILPRAKFVQNISLSVLSICLAAAISLLQIRCTVAARQGSPLTPTSAREYHTAANVTACVWLFFSIYLANTVRAYRPHLMITTILYCIFVIIASTYASSFPTMDAGISFVKRLLKTFLTGQGLATGVAFLILPVSSRMISHKKMAALLNLMKSSLDVHTTYMHAVTESHGQDRSNIDHAHATQMDENDVDGSAVKNEADNLANHLKSTLLQATQLFGQLRIEIGFAKKEIGWGKLVPDDFSQIWAHLRKILLPLVGLSTFVDILQSVQRQKFEAEKLIDDLAMVDAIRQFEAEEWTDLIVESRGPFLEVKAAFMGGLTHIAYALELVPRPKSTPSDIEKDAAGAVAPGDPRFGEFFKTRLEQFQQHREDTLRRWYEKKGIDVPAKFWEDPSAQYSFTDSERFEEVVRQRHNHQQLYLVLFLEYLFYSVGNAILDMVLFADSKVQDGTMRKKRLIFPGWRRIRKLFRNSLKNDADQGVPDNTAGGYYVWVGDGLSGAKDPEHLPPVNWYQRATNALRLIPKFLGSVESAYGFRTAVAVVSLGVLAYIRQTTHFYLSQRGIWAVIMTAISLGSHTGAGVQGFIARLFGTLLATIASIAIWYMGDQKPAAIIPLSYLYFAFGLYFVVKKPRYLITAIISVVTLILIVGYEMQDLKIGTQLLESNGQQFYRVYILAPYRLATVATGLGVAFFWSYFPYPITTHSTLRKDLGTSLFLMAKYYSCTHATIEYSLHHGARASLHDKTDPIRRLDKERMKVFEKMIGMLNRLREHSQFTRFEPTFGGRFPKETYDSLIGHMESLFNYMALINYSSRAFSTDPSAEESQWLKGFRAVTASSQMTSHELTSILCLVSASITNSQPLPPYLRVGRPVDIADQLGAIDPGILSVKHIHEPCYAAFAVLEIANILIMLEIQQVLNKVRELIGEVDFSIHFNDAAPPTSRSTLFEPQAQAEAQSGSAGAKGKAD